MCSSIGQCIICVSSLFTSDIYAITKCGHTFHESCIKQWITNAFNCPTCRITTFEHNLIKLFIQESTNDLNVTTVSTTTTTTMNDFTSKTKVEEIGNSIPKTRKMFDDLYDLYDLISLL